jgi:hypothetical protein
MRIQLMFVSARPGYVFMRRRLGCPAALLRGCAAAVSLFNFEEQLSLDFGLFMIHPE